MTEFCGKTAVITGAAGGIGRSTAIRFARAGASVVIADLNQKGLHETAEMIGEKCLHSHTGDCADEDFVRVLVERTVKTTDRIDAFFANAGISGEWTPLLDLTAEEWMQVLRINLLGPAMAIKHAGRAMIKQGTGAIICTASVGGLAANAGPVHYSASKAGVINLVKTAATSFSGTGVRVNAVCPGLIETPMMTDVFERARAKGKSQMIGQLNPMRRAGSPDDVAQVACFLASDSASYVTGQALPVDGGLSCQLPFAGRVQT